MSSPTIKIELDLPSETTAFEVGSGSESTIGSVTYLIGGGDSVFVDKTTLCRSFSTSRGSSGNDMVWTTDAGTASIELDNRTRTFDQLSNSDIRPGRQVRIRAVWNSTTYNLFRGYVDSWQQSYPGFAKDATTTAACNDGTALLANLDVNLGGAEELTGSRVRRLADAAGWSNSQRDINPGVSEMPAARITTSAWSAMQEAAVSEFGEVYVDEAGTLTFRDRDDLWTTSRTRSSQATFGDGVGELRFVELEPDQAESGDVRNRITVVYNEQDGQTADDVQSQLDYGIRAESLQVSLTDENTADAYARFLISQFADPQFTFGSITIVPRADPTNLWPQVLGRKLGDRITIKLTPPGGGSRIERECFIRQIDHDVSPGIEWTTTWGLSPADLWPDYFIIGTHDVGDSTNKIGW
jgi:hypothetical protein